MVTQETYAYNISMSQSVSGTVSQPAIEDIDKDGKAEIVIVGANGYIYVLDHSGGSSTIYKWKSDYATVTAWGSPRISDIDEDGVPEIIVG